MATRGMIDRPATAVRRIWAGFALTAANGIATFNFPAGRFTSMAPIVEASVNMGTNDALNYICQVISTSISGCLVEVQVAGEVNVLGIGVLGATNPLANIRVEVIATEAG